ncbi:MAG: cytochrome c [Planctomycetia bacterium]|nr:cytochrome c [Planctomycetia bacterium]
MCRICWLFVVVLLVATGTLVGKFIIVGETQLTTDGRTAILLEPAERDLILTEMRALLASVQGVLVAAGSDDMKTVVEAARKSGMPPPGQVPDALVGKLPLSFKTLGFDTHKRFDQLALDADQLGDKDHVLEQLGVLMNNCIACHAQYRLEAVATAGNSTTR